jgi:fumarate hydratase, class I
MEETLKLSKYPVTTALALTGTIIVARDIAHAKLKEILEKDGDLPDYFKKYPVYYAGPAKTPAGMPSGSFGPTTAGRMDSYVDLFQSTAARWSCSPRATARSGDRRLQKTRRLLPRLRRRPRRLLAQDHIKSQEVVAFPELGMEAVWKITVENFPAFILVDDKGNDFFTQINTCPVCTSAAPRCCAARRKTTRTSPSWSIPPTTPG